MRELVATCILRPLIWVALLTGFATSLCAQVSSPPLYQERSVSVRGIDLHYLDFGGKGLPIIFLQSFHGDAKEWVDYDAPGFAPRFVKDHRVYAVTRRGWGKSTDTYWGFDVATQAEDTSPPLATKYNLFARATSP